MFIQFGKYDRKHVTIGVLADEAIHMSIVGHDVPHIILWPVCLTQESKRIFTSLRQKLLIVGTMQERNWNPQPARFRQVSFAAVGANGMVFVQNETDLLECGQVCDTEYLGQCRVGSII